jgi:hypothetical protein
MRQYQIQHLQDMGLLDRPAATGLSSADLAPGLPSAAKWHALQPAPIDQYLDMPNLYRPRAEARLGRDDQALYVRLHVVEKDPLITWHTHQDPVYRDSCLEFFVQPNPAYSKRYLNFEFNAAGIVLSAYGEGRHDRVPLTSADLASLVIDPQIISGDRLSDEPSTWQITCRMPRALLERYCGPIDWLPGHTMAGNFYKCGDQTAEPHYGCWNLVSKPDFHRSEDFGRLVFV